MIINCSKILIEFSEKNSLKKQRNGLPKWVNSIQAAACNGTRTDYTSCYMKLKSMSKNQFLFNFKLGMHTVFPYIVSAETHLEIVVNSNTSYGSNISIFTIMNWFFLLRRLFKGWNFSRMETIWWNTVYISKIVTLESEIDVGQGITVGSGKLVQKNKHM